MSFWGRPSQQQQPQQRVQQQQIQQQQHVQQVQPNADWVPAQQHQYVLTNFKIAHEKVEQQRKQLEEQERQVAQLRLRIQTLEGGNSLRNQGKNTVDDFSIKTAASQLDKLINAWATEIVSSPPVPLEDIGSAILQDIVGPDVEPIETTPIQTQSYLRHAMSEAISEGIINCLIVTNSTEANVQLTRIHEHLFARDPTVACVWRRQTFSAAVETCTPELSLAILQEHIPTLMGALNHQLPVSGGRSILDAAYTFSRMLHGSPSTSGGATDTAYRAFVPELGSALMPTQLELIKRCPKSERGEPDRVGATIFPGLVKVSRASTTPGVVTEETIKTVVRRAQVICECALGGPALPVVPYDLPSISQPGMEQLPPHENHAHAVQDYDAYSLSDYTSQSEYSSVDQPPVFAPPAHLNFNPPQQGFARPQQPGFF